MNTSDREGSPSNDGDRYVRMAVDLSPTMLAYWDRDLRCRFANRAYEQRFGMEPVGLLGSSLRDLLGPGPFAASEPYVLGALRGDVQTFECIVPGRGGIQPRSLCTYIPNIVEGEVKGFVVHASVTSQSREASGQRRELAQREHPDSRLRASEAALREAQRLGQIGSWEWDAASDVATWSDELFRIFGSDANRPAPLFVEQSDLYAPSSWIRLNTAVSHAMASGDPYCVDLEYRRPDGTTGWLEARGEVVKDEQGTIRGLRGTAQDVSLRHDMEDSRVRLEVAEAASRNKTAMLSRVSHELRTPLNAILGFALLCRGDQDLTPKHRQWADLIVASGEQMLQLVNDVLDLSAMEAGQISLNHADFDVAALLHERMLHISPAAQKAGVAVVAWPTNDGLQMSGDPPRVRQVIDNLLSHAVKSTPRGGRVTVGIAAIGASVEIKVIDTAGALSSTQIDKLLVPFDRLGVEVAQTHSIELGLALTKTLVNLMGGTIAVSSAAGTGNTFVVTLPTDA